jgi:hypothetical protein
MCNEKKTISGACATHLAAPRFKINAVFKNCKFSKRTRNEETEAGGTPRRVKGNPLPCKGAPPPCKGAPPAM